MSDLGITGKIEFKKILLVRSPNPQPPFSRRTIRSLSRRGCQWSVFILSADHNTPQYEYSDVRALTSQEPPRRSVYDVCLYT